MSASAVIKRPLVFLRNILTSLIVYLRSCPVSRRTKTYFINERPPKVKKNEQNPVHALTAGGSAFSQKNPDRRPQEIVFFPEKPDQGLLVGGEEGRPGVSEKDEGRRSDPLLGHIFDLDLAPVLGPRGVLLVEPFQELVQPGRLDPFPGVSVDLFGLVQDLDHPLAGPGGNEEEGGITHEGELGADESPGPPRDRPAPAPRGPTCSGRRSGACRIPGPGGRCGRPGGSGNPGRPGPGR